MSNLSDLLPAGASAKEATFTASGAISSGDTVILNADGTTSAVVEGQIVGSPATFESATTELGTSIAYDSSNNKIVIGYRDAGNGGYGTAVVATVSGSSITYGTPVVFASASTDGVSGVFDSSNNKVVFAYTDAGNLKYGTAIVGTVSGTSISFGTEAVFESDDSRTIAIGFDSSNNKVVIAFRDQNNSLYGTAVVGTVSGTSISFGTATVFESASTSQQKVVFDSSNNKIVICYTDGGNSNYPTAIVGTVSGTSISFGTAVVMDSNAWSTVAATFDSNSNKVVIGLGKSTAGSGIVGTVSGTSISFGTIASFATANSSMGGASFDTSTNKVAFTFADGGNSSYGTFVIGTVSGTDITFDSEQTFDTNGTNQYMRVNFDSSANRFVVAYRTTTDNYGNAVAFSGGVVTNVTTTNFLGIAKESIANAASGEVVLVGGISENATSIVTTTNSTVYVQDDGTLSTTVSSVEAGLAFGAFSGTVGYNISNADYDSVSLDLSSQDTTPAEIVFNSDGTKMFIAGQANSSIFQYSLTTAYDLSTASYDSVSFSVAGQASAPRGLCFNPSGTKMLVIASDTDTIYQYSLSTGFNLSTASYDSVSLSVTSLETNPQFVQFNDDGTSLYFAGTSTDTIYQYDMSSAYDLSTASNSSKSFNVSSQETSPQGLFFRPDGLRFFICGAGNDSIYQYSLGTAFDISTASYDSVSFGVPGQDTAPLGVTFNSDGTKMYVVGNITDAAYQYSTTLNTTSKLLLNG